MPSDTKPRWADEPMTFGHPRTKQCKECKFIEKNTQLLTAYNMASCEIYTRDNKPVAILFDGAECKYFAPADTTMTAAEWKQYVDDRYERLVDAVFDNDEGASIEELYERFGLRMGAV